MMIPVSYQHALSNLMEGEAGVDQVRGVRRHLKAMERAGLVRYVEGAWYLTNEGREAIGSPEDQAAMRDEPEPALRTFIVGMKIQGFEVDVAFVDTWRKIRRGEGPPPHVLVEAGKLRELRQRHRAVMRSVLVFDIDFYDPNLFTADVGEWRLVSSEQNRRDAAKRGAR